MAGCPLGNTSLSPWQALQSVACASVDNLALAGAAEESVLNMLREKNRRNTTAPAKGFEIIFFPNKLFIISPTVYHPVQEMPLIK